MLQMESEIPVADNTGAKMAEMIGVLGRKNSRFAYVGDIITAHVRESSPTAAVKKRRSSSRRCCSFCISYSQIGRFNTEV